MRLTAENWSGRLEFRSALDGSVINDGVARYRKLNSRHLDPLESNQFGEDGICLKVQTHQSRLQVAMAARTRIYRNGRNLSAERRTIAEKGYIAQMIGVKIEKEVPITVEKVVGVFTSRDPAISEAGLAGLQGDTAGRRLQRPAPEPRDDLEPSLAAFRHELRVQGRTTMENRSAKSFTCTFSTCCRPLPSTPWAMRLDVGVPARGWHGEAYRGHIFWDELFIFPLLNWRMPEITRRVLMYRYRRLDAARAAAREHGYRGGHVPVAERQRRSGGKPKAASQSDAPAAGSRTTAGCSGM